MAYGVDDSQTRSDKFQTRPRRLLVNISISDMDKDVLEAVLYKCYKDDNIKTVLAAEAKAGVPKGINYTSTIIRIKLRVVLGNGRLANRTVILKTALRNNAISNFIQENNIFSAEVFMYSSILKEMDYLMEEYEDNQEKLWCNMIHYEPGTSLLFEDLVNGGFQLVKRQVGMGLEHGLLVLHSLGRYHGMIKVLEERGIINKNDFQPYLLLTSEHMVKTLIRGGLLAASKGITKYWGKEWHHIAEKLILPVEWLLDKFLSLSKTDDSMFTVLNHGDLWTNNMMFKYDWQGRPISVRFLDFQAPHHNSPCVDITYYLYFGLQPGVRRQHYRRLLECYHNSLSRALDKFEYTGSKPGLEEILKDMQRLSFFGLTLFAYGYPILTSESEESFDFEKILSTNGEEGVDLKIFKGDLLIERMGPDLIDYVQNHLSIDF